MSKTNTLPKIEKGIPVPNENERYGSAKAILNSMEVGDSVLLPKKHANSIRTTAWVHKIKVATRKVSKTEMRVWRIA